MTIPVNIREAKARLTELVAATLRGLPIAYARAEGWTLVAADRNIRRYPVPRV
jgi:hypothetical protein